jgi:predicted dehydrogenase
MKIRVALVGTGFISDFHVRALSSVPGAELVAICDSDPRKAEAVARRWAIPHSYHSLDAMLGTTPIDAVHILVPPPYHASVSLACLEAGCDLLIEKPLAATAAECLDLKDAAERSSRIVGVNHNAIYHPSFRRLVRGIQQGLLGGVQHVTACLNVPLRQLTAGQHEHWMFQKPGNIVLEQAPHPLSQIQFLLGNFRSLTSVPSEPVRLNSGKLLFSSWHISLICERGSAQCFLSFGKEYYDSWLHAIGQDGSAFLDLRRNTLRFTDKSRFMEPLDQFRVAWGSAWQESVQASRNLADYVLGFMKLKPAADPFYRGMCDSIRGFYEARAGQQVLPASLEDATAVIQACEAIAQPASEQSEAETHKWERVTS